MTKRAKSIFLWSLLSLVAAAILAVIIVPPFLDYGFLKPRIETAVKNQTGLNIKIGGDVRLSLLGRALITADRVEIAEYGAAKSVSFYVPYKNLFNLKNADVYSSVIVRGADIKIASLSAPADLNMRVILRDSSVEFMGKKYQNIDGELSGGLFDGTVRTDDHKYTLRSDGDTFLITNPNVNLNMSGQLFLDNDGLVTAVGEMSIETDDVNKWFEFSAPLIRDRVKMQSDFWWHGDKFRFTNIVGTMGAADFKGDIAFGGGDKKINITAQNANLDISGLSQAFFDNADITFAATGRIKMPLYFMSGDTVWNRVDVSARNGNLISMSAQNADSKITVAGSSMDVTQNAFGKIKTGRQNILDIAISTPDFAARCAKINTIDANLGFVCAPFAYSGNNFNLSGAMYVPNAGGFEVNAETSVIPAPAMFSELSKTLAPLGIKGGNKNMIYESGGVSGIAEMNGDNFAIEMSGLNATNIRALNAQNDFFQMLPDDILTARGNVKFVKIADKKIGALSFDFDNGDTLQIADDGAFAFRSDLIRLLSGIDTKFLVSKIPVSFSGFYKAGSITDLVITLFGAEKFAGKFDGKTLDLSGAILDMDKFINPRFRTNYESESFVTAEPLTAPFAFGFNISLSADKIKLGGEEYAKFLYSLKSNVQRMSVTDAKRGAAMLSIEKNKSRYKLVAQLDKFYIADLLLPKNKSLNISGTNVTAIADMTTAGITAHDFRGELAGELDMIFTGGTLHDFGTDGFYDNAAALTRLNAEYAIARAFDYGETKIKDARVIGRIANGKFVTTAPIEINARHTNITGALQYANGNLSADMSVLLRGTSPAPRPVNVVISDGGVRSYSLTEIMQNIDPDYMREFIRTHSQF